MIRFPEFVIRAALGEDVRLAWGESGHDAATSARCAGTSPPN